MSAATTSSTRESVKENQVLQILRKQIVTMLRPGSRLSTRRELEQQLQVSRSTLQRVLHRLQQDGFVRAKGSQGTYVVDRPPYLTHYGLTFAYRPVEHPVGWSRFWQALSNEAARIDQQGERRVPVLYHGEGHNDSEDYQNLLHLVESQRLAGLIFGSPPNELSSSPILDAPNLPRVCTFMSSEIEGPTLGMGNVVLDVRSFIERALDYLKERGRRRVAVISLPNWFGAHGAYLAQAMAERQMETAPYWIHGVHPEAPHFARNVAQLLMRGPAAERPDGLIIADDNLVEHAGIGLVAAGVQIPTDLDVVAHCNFPWPTASVLAVTRLGYDVREVLQACIDNIDRQRAGETNFPVTRIAARFETEVV